MFTKFKKAVGIISHNEFMAITAVKRFNDLVKQYNNLIDKFCKSEPGFNRDVIDGLLMEVLEVIFEQATMIEILREGEEKHFRFEDTFPYYLSKTLHTAQRSRELPTNAENQFDYRLFGFTDLIHSSDHDSLKHVLKLYVWLEKTFNRKTLEKMILKSLLSSFGVTADNARVLHMSPDMSLPKSSQHLQKKLLISFINNLKVMKEGMAEKPRYIDRGLLGIEEVVTPTTIAEFKLVTQGLLMNSTRGNFQFKLPHLSLSTFRMNYIGVMDEINKTDTEN
jgi:hypothetical protein